MASRQPAICRMSRKTNVYHPFSFWPLTYWQRNVKWIFLKKESPYCRNRLKKDGFGRIMFAVGENPGPRREVVADAQLEQPPRWVKWKLAYCKEPHTNNIYWAIALCWLSMNCFIQLLTNIWVSNYNYFTFISGEIWVIFLRLYS